MAFIFNWAPDHFGLGESAPWLPYVVSTTAVGIICLSVGSFLCIWGIGSKWALKAVAFPGAINVAIILWLIAGIANDIVRRWTN
jgi:hypothetical protein